MTKTKSYHDFERLVYQLWKEDRHKYGSMQYPAREAKEIMQRDGVENSQQLYDDFYNRNRATFHYAGD